MSGLEELDYYENGSELEVGPSAAEAAGTGGLHVVIQLVLSEYSIRQLWIAASNFI